MKETKIQIKKEPSVTSYQAAVDSYINGNISDFKHWLQICSKRALLDAIEYATGQGVPRHEIINKMRGYL